MADGIASPSCVQRHGSLVDTLLELEKNIRLLVMGKHGESTNDTNHHVGSHLETVIRTMHRPILVTPHEYREPKRVMFAFDGSATTRKGMEMVANSPLFKGLSCHIVMAGKESTDFRAQLDWAKRTLERAGFDAAAEIREGDVISVTEQYRQEYGIDLLIMGAYGHSRIREFLVGSTTTKMLSHAPCWFYGKRWNGRRHRPDGLGENFRRRHQALVYGKAMKALPRVPAKVLRPRRN